MKILHITDSHTFHNQLKLQDADVLCFTGDATNYRDPSLNHKEFRDFYEWLSSIRDKYKRIIVIAGNHDSTIYHYEKECKKLFKEIDVDYLHDSSVIIDNVEFYGSPWSPTFGDWCFMQNRNTLNRRWELIPQSTQVLLTHTPPKGILDITLNRDGLLERCGCNALLKTVYKLPNLKAHLYGHIHCLDTDSEILTKEGWKSIETISYDDIPITYNMKKGLLEYDEVKDIIKSNYKGDMIYLKGRGIDFMCTPNHDLIDIKKDVYKYKASDIFNRSGRKFLKSNILYADDLEISDLELRLAIQCTTDGSYEDKAWRFHLKKERKILRLVKLLEDMNIPFTRYVQSSGNTKIRFKYDFKYPPKPLPIEFYNLSYRQIEIFLNEYYVTDGYRCKEGLESFQISTAKKQEADIIQALCTISNRNCSVSIKYGKYYIISINESKNYSEPVLKNLVNVYNYDNKIWCITTKNGTIVSRRNGKTMISGNSSRDVDNIGILNREGIQFSNASAVLDGQFQYGIQHHGNIIEI